MEYNLMTDNIKTTTISRDFAKADFILLNRTPTTALVFKPQIHNGGVRGDLVRFKKENGKNWEEIKEVNFKSLNLYEGVHIELNTQSLNILIEKVQKLQTIAADGVKYGDREYVVAEKDEAIIINDKNKIMIFEQLLNAKLPDEFWETLQNNNPEIAHRLVAGHIQLQRKLVVDELQNRLSKTFHETVGDDSWQKWIYQNSWLFGVKYKSPLEKVKINITGVMPDYLFPTIDGFIDVLEIKLPDSQVIIQDSGHPGSWYWSSDAIKAIGQVVNYLHAIEINSLQIERHLEREYNLKVSTLKPRGHILIGNSADWNDNKKEGLRKLNYHLHNIEVITYQQLLDRGNSFINTEP